MDLGYDSAGHPVAMRLTKTGGRIFGATEGAEVTHATMGNLIVTPDFEVVLFPSGDDAEVIQEAICRALEGKRRWPKGLLAAGMMPVLGYALCTT